MRGTKCPLDWKYAYISSPDGRNQENVRSVGQRFGLVMERDVGERLFVGKDIERTRGKRRWMSKTNVEVGKMEEGNQWTKGKLTDDYVIGLVVVESLFLRLDNCSDISISKNVFSDFCQKTYPYHIPTFADSLWGKNRQTLINALWQEDLYRNIPIHACVHLCIRTSSVCSCIE